MKFIKLAIVTSLIALLCVLIFSTFTSEACSGWGREWKQPSDEELKVYLPPGAQNIHYIGNKYWTFDVLINGRQHYFLYCLQISPNYSIGSTQVTQGSLTELITVLN